MEQPASVSACASVTGPAEVFRALGENWWKPFIDGRFHQYGKSVFDQGLHRGSTEPGYLESLKRAYDFVAEHVTDRATPELYKKIHSIACAHFAGEENNTLVSTQSCGKFYGGASRSRAHLVRLFPELSPEERASLKEALGASYAVHHAACYGGSIAQSFSEKKGWNPAEFNKQAAAAKKKIKEFDRGVKKRIELVGKRIKEVSSDLGLRPIAVIARRGDWVYCHYHRPGNIEKTVQKTFDLFYERIATEPFLKGRVRHAANVFQTLEWLHPFPDGQGRTDLLLLAKMLCEVGANPAILDQPYISTVCSLDGWTKVLERGMERWKKELASMATEPCQEERLASA